MGLVMPTKFMDSLALRRPCVANPTCVCVVRVRAVHCCVLCVVVCCCVLCVVCCVLCTVVCCVLCVVVCCCVLCVVFSVLCAVCCALLCVVCCVLCVVCCVLCAVCCVLCAVCCVLCAVCRAVRPLLRRQHAVIIIIAAIAVTAQHTAAHSSTQHTWLTQHSNTVHNITAHSSIATAHNSCTPHHRTQQQWQQNITAYSSIATA